MKKILVALIALAGIAGAQQIENPPVSPGAPGFGTVTSVATGCGTSGGTITTTGTIIATETVNVQTGTAYAIVAGDCGKLVTGTNSMAQAYSIAQAGTTGFPAGWFVDVENRGAGTLTITPATSTIDGAATLALTTNQGVRLTNVGGQYYTALRGTGTPVGLPGINDACLFEHPVGTIEGTTACRWSATGVADGSGYFGNFVVTSSGDNPGQQNYFVGDFTMIADPTGQDTYPGGLIGGVETKASNVQRFQYVQGTYSKAYHRAIGPVTGALYANYGDVEVFDGAGNVADAVDYYSYLYNEGTIARAFGYWFDLDNSGGGTQAQAFAFYSTALGGKSALPYPLWFDEQGVYRVRADNTFDSVYQAIPALYNPQFTKYTPGAPRYERLIDAEWNGNVSEIGNYAGGTGTVRNLKLMGAELHFGQASNIANTTFVGAGLNDGYYNGTYTGSTLTYCAIIDGTGTPDTFKWGTNGGCDNRATTVAITGANQALSSGVVIKFAATTGHMFGDKWSVVTTGATDVANFNGAGAVTVPAYLTATNCADSAGAAACGSAAAGRFVADAAATTVVVSTTAVTANSEIFIEYDSSLSAALSVTCNATIPSAYAVTARTAGASFTLSTTANIANPGCFSYHVVN